jgi:hypothetical protein
MPFNCAHGAQQDSLYSLFDQASVFRGRWNYFDAQGLYRIPYKRDLCTAQVGLTAGVGFL